MKESGDTEGGERERERERERGERERGERERERCIPIIIRNSDIQYIACDKLYLFTSEN